MNTENRLAYCGLDCAQCSFRVAYETQNREYMMRMPAHYDRLKSRPLEPCPGCKGDSLCGSCKLKECASGRGVAHCGDCAAFPCDDLRAFANDGLPHHAGALQNLERIRAVGADAWFSEQVTHCECGQPSTWYCRCPLHSEE